jgi:DNA-binding transcriptional regulator LsrR (DeoR family)
MLLGSTIPRHFFSLYDREVILLCAGRQKLRALKGLLKAGFVKGLIIDGDTALSLIEE